MAYTLEVLEQVNNFYINKYKEEIRVANSNINFINTRTDYVHKIYSDIDLLFIKHGFVIYHINLETCLGGIGFRYSYSDIDISSLDGLLCDLREKFGIGVEIIDKYINIPFL